MNRPLAVIAAALLLVSALPSAAQQRVYQWKDANGVTHYTDLPPSQAHKTRDIDNKSGNPAEIASIKPVESQQCLNARSNLLRLKGNEAIGTDTNGDGKPDRELSSEERSAQTDLNQAAIKAYCPVAKP
ncbi:DUF4124 domain-containing protein [Thermomonas sp. HDW16]|uniref:DUF4124 domain-containing protein n=1 Tax=Thermomonas sp. HDW16 TaxID=2714945 RepID=UPI00140D2697|nr:DUF4124 domain-containing protein [Thermomonas sp. HDW16]QIL21492.1 DUF4124 domain-containing protein [Thermomonas sp. HDW16]